MKGKAAITISEMMKRRKKLVVMGAPRKIVGSGQSYNCPLPTFIVSGRRNAIRTFSSCHKLILQFDVVSFPDFGEFEEDTVRREHRDNQSRNAVAKALL